VSFKNPDPDKLVPVFENLDSALVSIARDALDSVQIESFVFDEHTPRVLGFRGLVYIRLMVYADQADQAHECLRDLGFEK
jgi:hypothetical protein